MDSDKEIMNKNASEGSEETISEFIEAEDIEQRFNFILVEVDL